MKDSPIALLNVTIATSLPKLGAEDAIYTYKAITRFDARHSVERLGHVSYIGHESTAQILTDLLETNVVVSREAYQQKVGETTICFKLAGRGPEGRILDRAEIEEIGYDFYLCKRLQ